MVWYPIILPIWRYLPNLTLCVCFIAIEQLIRHSTQGYNLLQTCQAFLSSIGMVYQIPGFSKVSHKLQFARKEEEKGVPRILTPLFIDSFKVARHDDFEHFEERSECSRLVDENPAMLRLKHLRLPPFRFLSVVTNCK